MRSSSFGVKPWRQSRYCFLFHEGTSPCWQIESLPVILRSNLFWYEFLRFILLNVVLSKWEFERERRLALMNALIHLYQKGSSATTFLLRVYHTCMSLHKWQAVLCCHMERCHTAPFVF